MSAVEKAAPAVVNVSARDVVAANADPMAEKFFEEMLAAQRRRQGEHASLGSGVLVRGDGFVVTNAHSIARGEGLQVTLPDERSFDAKVVGSDPETDIAVLKIDATDLPYLSFGSTSDLMLGETTIAIGNPLGFSHVVATGVVSATGRTSDQNQGAVDFIQTDASITPANSGGPLLDVTGALIGINVALPARAQANGFAVPAERASRVVADLIAHGEVRRGYLGLETQDVTPELATALGLDSAKGVLVRGVDAEGPAGKAGLKTGDVILSMGGRPVHGDDEVNERIAALAEGDSVTLDIVRDSSPQRITAVAGALTDEHLDDLGWRRLGLRLRAGEKTEEGLIVAQVRPRSSAAGAHIEDGDHLIAIGNIGTESLADYRRAIRSLRGMSQVQILVARRGARYQIMLPLEE